ncbi:MAG: hypothetical protein WC333_02325 [Dehalococcoidia bacterium]|jgi:hypothetical protein
MNKSTRQAVHDKFNGLCAYTGKPLGNDWQVDHILSKKKHKYKLFHTCSTATEIYAKLKEIDNLNNLLPAIKIINHYKRALDLEGFRRYMSDFHKRIAKLPKNPVVERSRKTKAYMLEVARLFDITPDKPFSGKFYFETVIKTDSKQES